MLSVTSRSLERRHLYVYSDGSSPLCIGVYCKRKKRGVTRFFFELIFYQFV